MLKTLPRRPSLDQLRRQAKDLLKQLRQHDPSALDRLRESHPEFERSNDLQLRETVCALHHAQLVVAREYGFANWPRLKLQIELLELVASSRLRTFVLSALVDHRDPKGVNFERAKLILEGQPDLVVGDFYAALIAGEIDAVERFLNRDPGLAVRTGGPHDWQFLLHVCFSRFLQHDESRSDSFVSIVRMLLAAGSDPNAYFMVNDDPNARQTCLYGAAGIAKHPAITKLLLDAGADPNDGAPGLGPESLYHAAEHQDVRCLQLILDAKPDPEKVSYCLGRCLDFENPAAVRLFLKAGADPNFVPPHGGGGSTRLHGAIQNGRSGEVIRLLIEAGADWRRRSHDGMTPYRLAIRTGHREAAALMESLGADPEEVTVTDRFVGACLAGDSERALEIRNANPQIASSMRYTDLAIVSVAAYLRRPESVRLMISLGFPIDAIGSQGMSALHWAGWGGDAELARFLIGQGANLELKNGYGGTVLGCTVWAAIHREVETDYAPVVRLLLESGAVAKDRCAYPTRIGRIDVLLKPYLD